MVTVAQEDPCYWLIRGGKPLDMKVFSKTDVICEEHIGFQQSEDKMVTGEWEGIKELLWTSLLGVLAFQCCALVTACQWE